MKRKTSFEVLLSEVGSARAQLFGECVAWQIRRKAEEVGGSPKLRGSECRRAVGSRATKKTRVNCKIQRKFIRKYDNILLESLPTPTRASNLRDGTA